MSASSDQRDQQIHRYVRGQLDSRELVEFEERMISDAALLKDVETEILLREGLAGIPEGEWPNRSVPKAPVGSEIGVRRASNSWRGVAAAAFLVLGTSVAVNLWQLQENDRLVAGRMAAPVAISNVTRFQLDSVRGGQTGLNVVDVRKDDNYVLLEIPVGRIRSSSLRAVVTADENGKRFEVANLTPQGLPPTVSLLLQASLLQSGSYSVALSALDNAQTSRVVAFEVSVADDQTD